MLILPHNIHSGCFLARSHRTLYSVLAVPQLSSDRSSVQLSAEDSSPKKRQIFQRTEHPTERSRFSNFSSMCVRAFDLHLDSSFGRQHHNKSYCSHACFHRIFSIDRMPAAPKRLTISSSSPVVLQRHLRHRCLSSIDGKRDA